MTRPQIIRADTIDLQDQAAPSAKDHSRQPTHPAAIGAGPAAPHQAGAIRNVIEENAKEQHPSSSNWDNAENSNDDDSDADHTAANGTHHHNNNNNQNGHASQNGGSNTEDADMADAEGDDSLDEDDMMDKISSSPSIDDEDIDFEFVYALHTFVATVEGQANAAKGDTMVLLDDSNSYWWLVRVVKDSSIGYLPAEHIETPTERLARLNKHRNIDLSATMLGDQSDKPKNPLKKAIRRRNAKTVTFNQTHTYVEASDVEYSSDEEDGENTYFAYNEETTEEEKAEVAEEDTAITEHVSERAGVREVKTGTNEEDKINASDASARASAEVARTSDEIFEGRPEGTSKSRNGTVRNTDSFFKDDTVETRKITITPNLLRDESSTTTRTSNDSKEIRERRSLDKLEKDSTADKAKDKKAAKEKKDKDKKPGMLSGLFKRKDKKTKPTEEDSDDIIIGPGKASSERTTSPAPSRDSEEVTQNEDIAARARNGSPQRHPGKLQKQRSDTPSKLGKQDEDVAAQAEPQTVERSASAAGHETMRLVQPDGPTALAPLSVQKRSRSPSQTQPAPTTSNTATTTTTTTTTSPKSAAGSGTLSKILRARSDSEPKPERLKKAKERLELDDSDSPSEDIIEKPTRPAPGAFPDSYTSTTSAAQSDDTLTATAESPSRSQPPALVGGDTSSPESSPSPELGGAGDGTKGSDTAMASTRTSASTWSDSQLRSFFDDGADVRDLLIVVYDKTGVEPAGPDHPLVGGLFRAEEARVRDLGLRLDNMLGDWLARKRTVAPAR